MSFTVIIPARFGSTRLPGKPLLDIAGQPMVQHVYQQAGGSNAARVVVATDDSRIEAACESFGGDVVMTAADHASGTDRLQEVAQQLRLADDAVVVNVQGDEPLIPPGLINQVAEALIAHPEAGIATLCEAISTREDLQNPNIVKVVMDQQGRALYFSRAPIPWPRDHLASGAEGLPAEPYCFRHIGIYAYRVGFLNQFVSWDSAPLERLEQLEQLRAMYHGVPIQVALANADVPGGVDTEEDLERVRQFFSQVKGRPRL